MCNLFWQFLNHLINQLGRHPVTELEFQVRGARLKDKIEGRINLR